VIVWLHQHPSAEAPEFRIGRDGDELVAEWIGLGVLRATARGGEFTAVPDEK
jgi:hypothetical protein